MINVNTLLENLLTVFLKITLLSWLIWGIVGSIIVIVVIYIFLNERYNFSKFIIYALPIIIIPLMLKSILSNEKLIEYIPMFDTFRNINQYMFIAFGIILALVCWNWLKELS